MREHYELYQKYLGEIPDFLKKYLTLNILLRLKDISLLCGMDYASKSAYDFNFFISRYDHSINVAMITWRLTHDKKATLAALFHDVASPVFSHVIDYMNGDFLNQESTEEKTAEILRNSRELLLMLEIDNISVEDIIDFKKYPIVDSKRPKMCADRLDNIISVGMTWVKNFNYLDAKEAIDNIYVAKNEDGEDEIGINNIDIARKLWITNISIDRLTRNDTDTYMMMLMASIIRRCIDLGFVSYDELFKLGEHDVIDIIERNKELDETLDRLWDSFKNSNVFRPINKPQIKVRDIDPIVLSKRLSEM